MMSEMDLQYLDSSEAYRVFAVSDSGLCSNGALLLSDRAPLLHKVVGIKAYRTKCVSTLGASAQVDAPFSAV